ncbi:hypothetical protein F9278_09895 [Streptomyces phaeolivaceus]|uniref:Uncharacterized protein n=1 Tax=Streptomyces phaeolivaceus TaxID=2653200 RepID=A0A5P8K1I5_9ACTN|nr:hypothetical protein [Streptomyces phaeolivaceus]QFQ96467.1 hypothetical protein F9278_09895 [Streptomyces phaeolivaceus]
MRHATEHADVAAVTDDSAAELESVLRGGPFHVALRAAIAARGLPLQRVQHHLSRYGVKVGVTSLSYWQQGARRPQRPESLRAVRALEEILQLPDESLIRLLVQADEGPGPERSASRSYRSVVEASGVLERLLGELGVTLDGGVHTVGHHERVRLGACRELLGRESQQIVRAHKDGVDRYVAVHHGDPGCAPERMAVRALENCRSGRVRWDQDTGILVAELLFDTRLRSGDTFFFRYGFDDGTAGVCTEYVRDFRSTGGQYALQVRFDERALPLRCHRFSQHSAAAPRSGRQTLSLSALHRSVHLVEPRVRTGIVGIGWDWE